MPRPTTLMLTLCTGAVGCQSGPQQPLPAPLAHAQQFETPSPQPETARKPSAEELVALAALPWRGDAMANYNTPFQGRYAQSGGWGPAKDGRRPLIGGDYGLHYGPVAEGVGYVVVDEMHDALRLRFYDGATFTPKDVVFEMPLTGSVSKIAVECAHDELAVLGWDTKAPQLSVYRQGDGAQRWSEALDIHGATDDLVLAWHDTHTLAVEWRSEKSYQRILIDGASGSVLLREDLDPRVLKVIADPVGFILAAPLPSEEEQEPMLDEANLTTAQRWLRQPPQSLGSVCGGEKRDVKKIRVVELDDGILMTAEATHHGGGRQPATLPLGGASCLGVSLMDTKTLQSIGSWSTHRSDSGE